MGRILTRRFRSGLIDVVGDYDAFGRKAGEDPLADLGWEHSGSAAPAAPVAAAPATEEEPTRGTGRRTLSRNDQDNVPDPAAAPRPGRFARVVTTLVVLGVAGGAFFAVQDGIDSLPDVDLPAVTLPSLGEEDAAPPSEAAPEVEPPAAPPAGLAPRSLLRRANFGRAMDGLQARGLGRITNLRVAADRIDAQLLTKGGRLRNLQITPGPEVRELSVSGPGFGHVATFGYGAVDARAPERFVREATRRRGRPATRVDYLVLTRFLDDFSWSLFFKDGAHFVADEHGHLERRL